MALPSGSLVRVANQPAAGFAVLTGTTIGTLGSNTNGTTIETAGTYGTRVIALTATTFNGLLKGNGSTFSATTVGAELGYTAENVANKENVTLDSSSTKYPTNNLVKTNLDSFADDVDYAIMTNQRILFNF